MTTVITINAQVAWELIWDKETGHYIADCEALGLTVSAQDLPELHASIAEVLDLLMHELVEDGSVENFLKQQGWSIEGTTYERATPQERQNAKYNIPFHLLSQGNNGGFSSASA